MEKNYILFNPYADNGHGEGSAKEVVQYLDKGENEFLDMTKIDDYSAFFATLDDSDRIILCGGDGTLNRFANDCADIIPENEIYLFPVGTGNDFMLDLGFTGKCKPVQVNQYIKDLPYVEVNDKKMYFLDNVGYGIDGWVCEVADEKKDKDPGAKINYTSIAISGLLGKYKPCNATVTVDGVTKQYKKVWLAPAMNGRYYGGGMKVTPDQDRLDPERTISLMMFTDCNRLLTAITFPKIFKGEHVDAKCTVILKGHDITVEFDEPRAVQVDGETILGVKKYHAVKK